MAFIASLPTTTSSPSKSTTLGVEAVAFGVDHGDRSAALVDPRQHRERGAQVDADCRRGRFRHAICFRQNNYNRPSQ